jgi:hypothetical protein
MGVAIHAIPPRIQTAYHSALKPAPTAASHSNPVQSCRYQNNQGGIHGKSRDCASAASRGAQPDAVTGRDVRPSNFRDRVFERYGSIPQVKPTDPNRFGSFTAQNGAGAESAMGKGEESSAETKANHVGISPQEDCGGTKGTVGEDTGGEEEIGGGVTSAIRVKRAAMNKKKAQNQPSLSRIGRYPAHMKWLILGLVLMIPVGYWLSTKRRRMSNRIEDEIKKANAFRDQIENLVIAKGQCPTGDRNTPLMAYWSLIFDFHRGVLCLLSRKFYGSAFALVRPIVEAVVRSHVVLMGSEEDVRKLREDEYRTNLSTVGKEIDTAFGTDDFFENFLTRARIALHSYTHAGVYQLGRRFSGDVLVANYSEEEIIEVIRVSTSAACMVNNLVTKHFGFEEEWRRNNQLYDECSL